MLFLGLLLRTTASGALPEQSEIELIEKTSTLVPMRDGVHLETNIYRDPNIIDSLPVLIIRTPYNQEGFDRDARLFAAAGYVAMTQDSRGQYGSEGAYPMLTGEGQDAYDTFEWIREQPWCNGKIGTWGGSYMGLAQWMAAAEGVPIDAMAPVASCSDVYDDLYIGGVYKIAFVFMGYSGSFLNDPPPPGETLDWPKIMMHLPMTEIDKAVGRPSPWRMSFIKHHKPDNFWKRLSASSEIPNMDIPMLQIVGYYDFFCRGAVSSFLAMRNRSATAHSRENQQIILGPWTHRSGGSTKVEDMDFGRAGDVGPGTAGRPTASLPWFDRFLKGIGADKPFPKVRYFSMGDNAWHAAEDWPPIEADLTPYYLHSGGNANTRNGDGRLELDPPSVKQKSDQFVSDPDNPVPTAPGREEKFLPRFGPFDQQLAQDREDVLIYSTPPLEVPVRFAGPIKAELYVSADTPDADWVVKLLDIHPSGFAHPLATGVQRGSARESSLHRSLLTPGKIYRIIVDVGHTAARISPGHRLCIQIQGSNFPAYERGVNTGEGPTGTRKLVSKETVYHSPEFPSRVLLPMMPD